MSAEPYPLSGEAPIPTRGEAGLQVPVLDAGQIMAFRDAATVFLKDKPDPGMGVGETEYYRGVTEDGDVVVIAERFPGQEDGSGAVEYNSDAPPEDVMHVQGHRFRVGLGSIHGLVTNPDAKLMEQEVSGLPTDERFSESLGVGNSTVIGLESDLGSITIPAQQYGPMPTLGDKILFPIDPISGTPYVPPTLLIISNPIRHNKTELPPTLRRLPLAHVEYTDDDSSLGYTQTGHLAISSRSVNLEPKSHLFDTRNALFQTLI